MENNETGRLERIEPLRALQVRGLSFISSVGNISPYSGCSSSSKTFSENYFETQLEQKLQYSSVNLITAAASLLFLCFDKEGSVFWRSHFGAEWRSKWEKRLNLDHHVS